MFKNFAFIRALSIIFCISIPFAAWTAEISYPSDEDAAARAVVSQAALSLQKYRLSPGDVMEVLFHDTGDANLNSYKIAVGDELQIEFAYQPDFNRGVTVRTDGRITLPQRPEIKAFGLTPTALASEIVNSYRGFLRDPIVTVSVRKGRPALAELKEAIDPLLRGQSKRAIVSPDGRIVLPLLPSILSAGRTVDEVVAEVNQAYSNQFPTLRVSLLLESVAPNRVFVFGEVRTPGATPMTGPMTVIQALATAGGALETGSLSDVRILDWDENRQPRVRTVDLMAETDKSGLGADLWLPPNATVYLPPTTVARFGRAVDQIVRKIFLFNGFNIGLSYEMRRNTQ